MISIIWDFVLRGDPLAWVLTTPLVAADDLQSLGEGRVLGDVDDVQWLAALWASEDVTRLYSLRSPGLLSGT